MGVGKRRGITLGEIPKEAPKLKEAAGKTGDVDGVPVEILSLEVRYQIPPSNWSSNMADWITPTHLDRYSINADLGCSVGMDAIRIGGLFSFEINSSPSGALVGTGIIERVDYVDYVVSEGTGKCRVKARMRGPLLIGGRRLEVGGSPSNERVVALLQSGRAIAFE